MAEPSVFHPRTSQLCISNNWKEWGGYYAVCSYDVSHEGEYFAIRHSAGLLDVSPLLKYEIYGPDAALFLSRLTVKNVARLKIDVKPVTRSLPVPDSSQSTVQAVT